MKDIATKSTTQYILDKYDLYPKKKYGQNFLIDPRVVEKIVHCSSVNEKCAVIEVGPGIGALTQVLARCAGYVRSYEIDTRFKGVYEEFLNQENIEIVTVSDGSGRSAHLAGQYRRTDGRRGIDYFWHCIIDVFCDETDRLFDKETQNKKRKSAESQKKT